MYLMTQNYTIYRQSFALYTSILLSISVAGDLNYLFMLLFSPCLAVAGAEMSKFCPQHLDFVN